MFMYEHELIGQTLKGRYRLEKIIGRGSMGVVYLAHEKNLPDPLAIKVLLPKDATEFDTRIYDELSARFQRESALITTLRHKHIVPVYATGEHHGMAFFVMQYFAGGTLRTELRRRKTFSPSETLDYIKQAASALQFIHFNGIVHRDVKPANFLLDDHGQLVLTDFGVAHIIESTLTQTGQLWGTAAYASPEARRGMKADRRDDIYSLGVIVYELLTGNHPGMVNRPHPNITPAVAAVILKATASQRKDRYESASAMAKALEYAIKGITEDTEDNVEALSSTDEEEPEQQASPTGANTQAPGRSLIDALTHTWQSLANRIQFTPGLVLAITRSSRFKSYLVAASLVLAFAVTVIILLALILARTAPPKIIFVPPSTQGVPSTPIQAAQAAVEQYYAYWNSGNYQAAYNLLQASYRASNSYSSLAYQVTHRSCITIDSATLLNDGSVQVAVTDNAIENDPSGTGTVTNRYTLDFIASQEQGTWKLTPTKLQLISTQGVC